MKTLINIKLVDYTKKNPFSEITIENNTILEYNENTSIGDIRIAYNIPNQYKVIHINNYKVESRKIICESKFPYIIKDKKIKWNVDVDSTKVIDLIETLQKHNTKFILKIRYDVGNVGDPYFAWNYIWEWLNSNQIFLSNIASIVTVSTPIFLFIKNILKKYKSPVSNSAFVDYILKRNEWSSKELSNVYDLDINSSRQLLKLLGYKWDKKRKKYIISNQDKVKIKKKLEKLDMCIEKYVDDNIHDFSTFVTNLSLSKGNKRNSKP